MTFYAYTRIAKALIEAPPIKIGGRKVKEIINCQLVMKALPGWLACHTNPVYYAAQLAWYLRGKNVLDGIETYSEKWRRITNPLDVNSNYGVYIFNQGQWNTTITRLQNDPTTRQAIILFNNHKINTSTTSDHVCTTSLQFLIRDGALHLIVTMRSNDFLFGFAHDAPFFMMLQNMAAVSVDCPMGMYYHTVGSMHSYEEDWSSLNSISNFDKMSKIDDLAINTTHEMQEILLQWGDMEHAIRHGFSYDTNRQPPLNWLINKITAYHHASTADTRA
jgi:thymidylate synthase